MSIIGLTGYARVGKDTVGKILVDHHGFRRVGFADKLKDLAEALDPTLTVATPEEGDDGTVLRASVSELLSCFGSWEGIKDEFPEARKFLQTLGVAARDHLGSDVWVNAALADLKPDEDVVVTDCRFPNEAQAIHNLGGVVLRVHRPGIKPANGHVSETPLPAELVDATVNNDGSLDKLAVNLDLVLRYLNFRPRYIEGVAT